NHNKCKVEGLGSPSNFQRTKPALRQTEPTSKIPSPKQPIRSSSVSSASSSSQQSESMIQTINGFKEDVFTPALVQNYDNTTLYPNNETNLIVSSIWPIQVNYTNSFSSNQTIFNNYPASAAYKLVTLNDDPLIHHNFLNENVIVNDQIFDSNQIADISQDPMQPYCNFSDVSAIVNEK
ncbi:4729_t:CDS:2, partial [Gigaspora rosea]